MWQPRIADIYARRKNFADLERVSVILRQLPLKAPGFLGPLIRLLSDMLVYGGDLLALVKLAMRSGVNHKRVAVLSAFALATPRPFHGTQPDPVSAASRRAKTQILSEAEGKSMF